MVSAKALVWPTPLLHLRVCAYTHVIFLDPLNFLRPAYLACIEAWPCKHVPLLSMNFTAIPFDWGELGQFLRIAQWVEETRNLQRLVGRSDRYYR
jgi:hypothetical protein